MSIIKRYHFLTFHRPSHKSFAHSKSRHTCTFLSYFFKFHTGGGPSHYLPYIRVVRVFLLSVISTVEMIMGANGLLDSSTKVPKNQRKTVNSLMQWQWNKDQRQAVFVWRMAWTGGRIEIGYVIMPYCHFFLTCTPAVDEGTKQLWSARGGVLRLTLQMWTWRRPRLLDLFINFTLRSYFTFWSFCLGNKEKSWY